MIDAISLWNIFATGKLLDKPSCSLYTTCTDKITIQVTG